MDILIVSGLSGAGKSKAMTVLEDIGYYCVDNMPATLIPKFAQLYMAGTNQFEHVAMVTDIRAGQNFSDLFAALDELSDMGCGYRILFMEAETDTIIRRYKETRRIHPLYQEGQSLKAAIEQERAALLRVRERAEYIIDTTALSAQKLRGEVLRLFGPEQVNRTMDVSVISFGFKYGIPIEADLLFDVRFLPNPYYIPALRVQTGLDQNVRDYIFEHQVTADFMIKLKDLINFLLPRYVEEGKTSLVIAVGCTGGRHRSVAVTKELVDFIGKKGYRVSENHRDMTRA